MFNFFVCVVEYQLAKPSDSHRKEMLFGSLAKPLHPMAKFCWGNCPHRACLAYTAANASNVTNWTCVTACDSLRKLHRVG